MADADTTATAASRSGAATSPAPRPPGEGGVPNQPAIDVEALAEKVYRLMLAEIRLDRARGLSSMDGE